MSSMTPTPYGGHTPITSRGSEQGNRYSRTGYEILTLSGELIDIRAPRPEQIKLSDIAVGLATDVRFAGQCPLRPTVAQHSLAVELIAQALQQRKPYRLGDNLDGSLSRAALMHDAAEAYLNDLTGAVKLAMRVDPSTGESDPWSDFDQLEERWMHTVATRFDCSADGWEDIIHEADCIACAYEMAHGGWCAEAKPPEWAEGLVRDCYEGPLEWYDTAGDRSLHAFIERATELGMRDA